MMVAPAAQKPHPLRRQYFVNKRYQGRFIVLLCCLAAVVGGAAAGVVYGVVGAVLSDAMYRMQLPTGEVWKLIRQPLMLANLPLAGVSFLIAAAAVSLIVHRSGRALRAIESEIRAVDGSGVAQPEAEAEPLWHGIAGLASESLRVRMGSFVDAADRLDQAAGQWEQVMQSGVVPETSPLMDELDNAIEMVERSSLAFRC
jgi:hypothetical protein